MSDSHQPSGGLGALAGATGSLSDDISTALKAMAGPDEDVASTRSNVRQLLVILCDVMAPKLGREIQLPEGVVVVSPHWAVSLMKELVEALDDLDSGVTAPLLEKRQHGPSAALPTSERKTQETIVEAVKVMRGMPEKLEGKTAEKYVAEKLNKAGIKHRQGDYSEAGVRNLRKSIKRRKPTRSGG